MWNYLYVYVGLTCFSVLVHSFGEGIIGKGRWLVENVSKCPDPEKYPYDFWVKKRKLNRTHDGFNLEIQLPEDINEHDHGIYIEACIIVDGGCKLVQIFSDPSFCRFIMKYAEDNFKKGLMMAGLEPSCPIPKGHHELVDYMFDYRELSEDGMLGKFKSTTYLTKDDEKVGCILVDVTFEKKIGEYN